ncbi:hypothetical protein H7I96_16215 [Mycolicibacterium aichiense]|nr:hypothetical protein [Mycolicibacterium aichiense]
MVDTVAGFAAPVAAAVAVAAPVSAGPAAGDVVLSIVSEKTGYPVDMLGLGMEMEAELGIDSIKQVEILAALQAKFPGAPEIPASELANLRTLQDVVDTVSGFAAPASSRGPRRSRPRSWPTCAPCRTLSTPSPDSRRPHRHPLRRLRLRVRLRVMLCCRLFRRRRVIRWTCSGWAWRWRPIVSEKTGYPVDMLGLGMEMEAELGIDSIKQVEILAALQAKFPGAPEIPASELANLRTLQDVVDTVSGFAAPASSRGPRRSRPRSWPTCAPCRTLSTPSPDSRRPHRSRFRLPRSQWRPPARPSTPVMLCCRLFRRRRVIRWTCSGWAWRWRPSWGSIRSSRSRFWRRCRRSSRVPRRSRPRSWPTCAPCRTSSTPSPDSPPVDAPNSPPLHRSRLRPPPRRSACPAPKPSCAPLRPPVSRWRACATASSTSPVRTLTSPMLCTPR